MRILRWVLPLLALSFTVAADDKAELQGLYAAVGTLNQEQQALFQQFQMLQELRRANDRIFYASQLRSPQYGSDVPNYADVVVLDYGLPGKNGLQIYEEMLRLRACPVRCVMISGYPLEQISQPANKLGIHHLLNKPFSLSELQRLIDQSAEESCRDKH